MQKFGVDFGPNVIFATNPCRIRHFGRTIHIFRYDLCRAMQGAEAIPMKYSNFDPSAGVTRHEVAKTLVTQSHLCPGLPASAPVM